VGFIGKIIQVLKRKIKVDLGGGNILTADYYLPPGEDSKPLKIDNIGLMPTQRKGGLLVVGFIDLQNEPKSEDGEKRFYSRQSDGQEVAEIYLKKTGEIILKNNNLELNCSSDGSIKGSNSNGYFELKSNGKFDINGIIFSEHVHGGVQSGTELTGLPQ